ncbi:hypothetical protein AB0I84_09360 [Streptomyces spectabilis]|uniref:hypothetical protein n=1 Tax=Streptomyces spectabilis TaxID=68270 RepID=UPI0033CCAB0B
MNATTPRYQARHHRGWYVVDTHTGAAWTGLTGVGASQLADYRNRRDYRLRAAARRAAEAVEAIEAERATADGTWRGEWIGAQDDDAALFPAERDTDQGALFTTHAATAPTATEPVEPSAASSDAEAVGTWRAGWIAGAPAPAEVLFDLDESEQGALFG